MSSVRNLPQEALEELRAASKNRKDMALPEGSWRFDVLRGQKVFLYLRGSLFFQGSSASLAQGL